MSYIYINDNNPKTFSTRRDSGHHRSSNRASKSSNNHSSFNDRLDARVILELEKTLLDSPSFDLDRFNQELMDKDVYGNDQVSRQHVVQAAGKAKLNIE